MKIQHQLHLKTKTEYLEALIQIFCALGVDYKKQLTRKEAVFFVQCALLYADGLPLDSQAATKHLAKLFPQSKDSEQRVYQLRMKLKRKGWLIEHKGILRIHPFFDLKANNLWTIDLHLAMRCKTNGLSPSSSTSHANTTSPQDT